MALLAGAGVITDSGTDEELAAAAAAGDDDAFAALHARWSGPIHDYLARMTRNRDDAAELTQVTFEKAWRNLGRRRPDRGFKPWLYAIARNSALDALRRRRPVQTLDDESWAQVAGAGPDPAAEALAHEAAADVWTAAAALSPTEYTVLHYELRAGMGPADIAAATGMRTGAVYTALSRAKGSLAEAFTILQLARRGRRECPALNQQLGAEAQKELTKAVRQAVRDHLKECERCRATSARLVAPAELFASLGLVLPAGLRSLRKPDGADQGPPPPADPARRAGRARRIAAVAVAAAAALVAVGVLAMAGEGSAAPDRTPPADPQLRSPSHALGVPSAERTAVVAWTAGADPKVTGERTSGVAGYSVAWTNEPGSLPDATVDVAAGAGSASAPITAGRATWFHLRTADRVGNWTSTRRIGPFLYPLGSASEATVGATTTSTTTTLADIQAAPLTAPPRTLAGTTTTVTTVAPAPATGPPTTAGASTTTLPPGATTTTPPTTEPPAPTTTVPPPPPTTEPPPTTAPPPTQPPFPRRPGPPGPP